VKRFKPEISENSQDAILMEQLNVLRKLAKSYYTHKTFEQTLITRIPVGHFVSVGTVDKMSKE